VAIRTTIAIPAFNEERHIGEAIESALAQNANVLICDNSSSDGTRAICEAFAGRYECVTYVRHAGNFGAYENFKFGMDWAQTEFFMWLGAHDVLPPDYVSLLQSALLDRPDAVHAFGAVRYIDPESRFVRSYNYEFGRALGSPSPCRRLVTIARYLSDCSFVHGLFRLAVLRKSWTNKPDLGMDHALMASVATHGPLSYVPAVSYGRRLVRSEDSVVDQMERIKPGAKIDRTDHIYQQMILFQLQLFERLSDDNWLASKIGRLCAGYFFMRRFGPWAKRGSAARFLQDCFRMFGLILRPIRSRLRRD
jgi:O-antigen biosynthesis protein